jgi:hypothetical protein
MRAHLAYLKYVLRHKWFVFWACLKTGAGIWLGLIHDLSKFLPREWFPYIKQFYNSDGTKKPSIRDASGAYDPAAQPKEFQEAWLNHQRNRHHWQAWVSIGDGGKLTPILMPKRFLRELIADWMGAGMAQSGKTDPKAFYETNKSKMIFHDQTRQDLEEMLREI